ncbi:MAG: NAD(P) transhydrogenase subunit alpha [Chloroflexota bacterium]
MIIFTAKTRNRSETRTPLTPESAKKLVKLGAQLQAEAGLGLTSGYADAAYEAAGVTLVTDAAQARQNADIVFGVEKPLSAEIEGMKEGALFVGTLDPFNRQDLIRNFAQAKVNAVSMEMVPRTTLAQKMDVLSSQANLAGYYAVIKAAERLPKIVPMMMTPAGTIAPARIFVLGVGVAGLQAIATAKRLGARVDAFDTRPVVEEQVKSLGAKFVKIDLGEMGQTEQGYAKALTPEQIEMQRKGMTKVIAQSDIVITTAKLFGRPAPTLVTADMVAAMKPGSVIVDLAAETGGNVEGTQLDEEAISDNGVRIIGIGKLETMIPTHASQVYAANLANFVEHFWDSEANVLKMDIEDEIMAGSLLTLDGEVVHPRFSTTSENGD